MTIEALASMRTLYETDPWGPREVVREICGAFALTMGVVGGAFGVAREHGICGALLMSWEAYGQLCALGARCISTCCPGGVVSNRREPTMWYCGRPVIVIEDHPRGVVDFVAPARAAGHLGAVGRRQVHRRTGTVRSSRAPPVRQHDHAAAAFWRGRWPRLSLRSPYRIRARAGGERLR